MNIKRLLKYTLICWMFLSMLFLSGGGSVLAANQTLDQKLKATNKKINQMQQKKRQADLKLKKEKSKLSNNQQKLERTQNELRATTQKYNGLVSNLSLMQARLNQANIEFQDIDRAMRSRITEVFMHQRTGMFELILSAHDLSSLLDTFYFEKLAFFQLLFLF